MDEGREKLICKRWELLSSRLVTSEARRETAVNIREKGKLRYLKDKKEERERKTKNGERRGWEIFVL